MEEEGRETQCWRLWWAINGTISRLGCDLEQIAITNLLPFTVYDGERSMLARSSCGTWPKAVRHFLYPWLAATRAGTVIWLGKDGYRKAKDHWSAVPADAVVNRARHLSEAGKFKDLDEKIASGAIRAGGTPQTGRRSLSG
jgi:hypothetical protein